VASSTGGASMRGRLGGALVAIAAAFVILGVSIVPFLTPVWIHGEQDRAGTYVPGYSGTAVRDATDETVSGLLVGGDFTFMIHGTGFFDDREIAHMADVRRVLGGLGALILASVAGLLAIALVSRGDPARRAAAWRAVGRGATWLAGFMVVVGVLSVVAFDAAFQAFHELLFPAGSFSFDPATERLVQLFPDQFWSDTALALGVVAIVLSVGVAWLASRRAARVGSTAAVSAGAPTLAPRLAP
jgi:integral membrane protein (TIGR01906 family)